MLDNQQRAHDLAMVMLKFTLDHPETLRADPENKNAPIDLHVTAQYLRLYRIFLQAMEEEFPPEPEEED